MNKNADTIKNTQKKLSKDTLPAPILDFFKHLFNILLVIFFLFIVVEEVWSGSISLNLNLDYFLIIVVILGAISILSSIDW